MTLETLIQREDAFMNDLRALDDRMARYKYLLSYTDCMNELSEEECTQDNKLRGCVSDVWISITLDDGIMHLRASSDALIIKGLLGAICAIVDGREAAEVAAWEPRLLDLPQLRTQFKLDRRRAMRSIIEKITAAAIG